MTALRARAFAALAVALGVTALAVTALAQGGPAPITREALVGALQGGGYVLYVRHTSTDFSQNDSAMRPDDCTTQRNLTDAGRDEAREIGRAIERLRIPVSTVLASPYCRTMETGRLMFGRATPSPAVRGGPATDGGDRYADLRALLARGAPAGTNVAIASHGNPFHAVAGPPYLAEGEMAVVAPGGPLGFTVVARVRRDEWGTLPLPGKR